jgi:hypothetical protein
MDQSAKAISAYDPARRHRLLRRLAARCPLAESLVWPCLPVVLDEFAEHVLQVAMTHDQQVVQALAPGCPHPPFSANEFLATAPVRARGTIWTAFS